MYTGARKLLDLDLANNGSRYGFTLSLPQRDTELLLRARSASDGPLGYGYRVALGGDTTGRRPEANRG